MTGVLSLFDTILISFACDPISLIFFAFSVDLVRAKELLRPAT